VQGWPRLAGRVEFVGTELDAVEIRGADLVVSIHACGSLTDVVLDRASEARAGWPCCRAATTSAPAMRRPRGLVDRAAAIDIMRAVRLTQRGYRI